MKFGLLALLLSASAAIAQQPAPSQPYTVTLSVEHMQILFDALGELPLKRSEVVKNEVLRQVIAENEKRAAAAKPQEPEKK